MSRPEAGCVVSVGLDKEPERTVFSYCHGVSGGMALVSPYLDARKFSPLGAVFGMFISDEFWMLMAVRKDLRDDPQWVTADKIQMSMPKEEWVAIVERFGDV